jgi:putative aldouronate transport system substrate-binding protein
MKRIGMIALGMMMVSAFAFGNGQQGAAAGGATRITVEIFDRGTDGGKTDPTNNKWTQWIHDKLLRDENIDVKFVAVPRWTETEALVNLFAAGTAPDVCITYSGDNITNWGQQGGLFDLAPHIDTTLKDLKAFLGPDKAMPGQDMIRRNINNATKQIFSIPGRRMNVAQRVMFIRKDWLDKLGRPLPKTTDEFYSALVAFKEQDPGNVGKDRVIPFTMSGDRVDWSAAIIIESFVDTNLSDKDRWINTVAERGFLLPGYKEGVRFLNKMYNAGLIDKDFPLYKGGDNSNLLKSGVVGAHSGDWDTIYREPNGVLSDLQKNIPTAEFVPVDCMTSSDGITHKSAYDAAGVNFFIPASCKNTNAAMRYLNWLAKYDNYHFVQVGAEGTVHAIVDGVPKINPAAPDGWIQNSNQNIDYTPMMNGLFLGSDDQNVKALASGYSWPANVIVNAYNVAMKNAKPGVVVSTKAPLVVAGPLTQTLTDKGVVIYTQAVTCSAADFDRVYDSGVQDWLNSGAQRIIDERRANYPN